MLKLSIILPFYNVESYIEECIRSLYNQDILQEEYEVICVDDCSLDGSREIVERLQKEYSTLKLIQYEENKKLGGARNAGLNVAIGDYVWFVDSDDYVFPNTFKKLLDTAQRNTLDILQFDSIKGGQYQIKDSELSEILHGEQFLFNNLSVDWVNKISGVWKQLFHRAFLKKMQLQYIEGSMYEDTDYLLRAFLLAKRVQHISLNAYYYRVNANSVTQTPISPKKLSWRVNQIVRCSYTISMAQSAIAKKTITTLVSNVLSQLRMEIKKFTIKDKREYISHSKDVNACKRFVSWRTWLALRYGVTWFI